MDDTTDPGQSRNNEHSDDEALDCDVYEESDDERIVQGHVERKSE